jgi:hypothetical protein
MSDFQLGDRVELLSCAGCAAGTVTALGRRVEVSFDDQPGSRWMLKRESLRLVTTAATSSEQARQAKGPHATG